ncbi:MAG: glycoside hydrolase family 65 protein [Candidatus Omnitrophica bacterium]|nr:glycoside hydrolase family 65 protein [Candidatus Omnitrophota bacterium]MBU4479431.1 glycoside hydrolase family 65 protein [Candidatus Omnitrophota bacterium]MCG2703178.1 glycoside hydrolase family 65 protein [Candidatus Omnitrophota bacterium]
MKKKDNLWKLTYDCFEPDEEGLREVLCTLGNGYFATRGAAVETAPTETHYPGTYIAGVYNRLGTYVAGRTIYNEDLVNCPNWTYITFKVRDGAWFSPSTTKILEYYQELDMRNGTLSRKILCQMKQGYRTWVQETRIVHMANPHVAAIKYVITPENYSDYITVRSMLDGGILNMNVERYRELNSHHWRGHVLGKFAYNGTYLSVKTNQSGIEVCEAAKLRVFIAGKEVTPMFEFTTHGRQVVGQGFKIFARKRKPCQIEKTVSIFSSRDAGVEHPQRAAIKQVKNLARFDVLCYSHQAAWERLWEKCDFKVEGDDFSQRVLRLHIFHLLQTASPHNTAIDAGVPARGLHGEAYRGHVFWDELFVLPFFSFHFPEVSRALLMYRYRRLAKARDYAAESGYQGAMFPWQSGSSGKEETQVVHLNPRSGKWGPDYSRYQRHVSFAIAYNVWHYWKATNDLDFLERYGAELFLSIAQFGASLAVFNKTDGRFHTERVMGPDEFHERLPGSSEPGLKDNAYTNMMVVWTLLKAKEILSLLSAETKSRLLKKLGLTPEEVRRCDLITEKMHLIFSKAGIISQFDGYFQLKELDWSGYKSKYKHIERMDRILKSEGKSPDSFKVSKQADVLMIFYLLTFSEIEDIFKKLGYFCDKTLLRKNYDYYIKRTSHGSTLSKVVHCFIVHLLGREKKFWWWFLEVLESDIYDTQGGTTSEGIHTGVIGGSLDVAIRGCAGIQILNDRIKIEPRLPQTWERIRFKLCYRKKWVTFDITKSEISIYIPKEGKTLDILPFEINSKLHSLIPGKIFRFSFKK